MPQQPSCPEPALLHSLLNSQLSPTDEKALTTHLESCPRCRQSLQGLAASNESWSALAQHLNQQSTADEGGLTEVLNAACSAVPGSDTAEENDVNLDFLDPPDEPGHLGRLGPYKVLRIIGHGGMGMVLQAF